MRLARGVPGDDCQVEAARYAAKQVGRSGRAGIG